MTTLETLRSAVAAARAGDLATVSALVDWGVSGAGLIAAAVSELRPEIRQRSASSGLGEIDRAVLGDPEITEVMVRPFAARLAMTRDIRPASPEVRETLIAALRVREDLPPELSPEQVVRLAEFRAQVEAIEDVFVLVIDAEELPIAVTPRNTIAFPAGDERMTGEW
ncbi:hypothetical protein Lfu02_14150 [Longispora fulva]|uniref:Uncharacterized protein n=1 Tax=Longispora fulva TaxID=619741 RepID=A0A8J7GMM3_9ACTN|nr:hypothetical protein [Longispora fulva]MBG6140575.1 hypothetical protein [Longispora fulva]GIG57043.1 hypothetical protein Lfu02_14150 [Longispora fulva]